MLFQFIITLHETFFFTRYLIILKQVHKRFQVVNRHVSLYVSHYKNGEQRLIYVPKAWESRVRGWVATYQCVRTLLDEITEDCVRRLKERKE